jgi:hypothetical protein
VYYIKDPMKMRDPTHIIYDTMFSIDYNVDNGNYKFVTDMSFSHIFWNMIERLVEGLSDIKKVDLHNLELLSLCVFPGGNTLLHYLCY